MGYPTEDGSEHERLRVYPRAGIYLTNMALIIWRSCICRYLLLFAVFNGVFLVFFWQMCKFSLGIIFLMGQFIYVEVDKDMGTMYMGISINIDGWWNQHRYQSNTNCHENHYLHYSWIFSEDCNNIIIKNNVDWDWFKCYILLNICFQWIKNSYVYWDGLLQ